MVVKCNSLGLFGLNTYAIEIEGDLSRGVAAFDIVGLPDAAVKESRDRVRSAMKNCGFEFPNSRLILNLAPADIRKEGPLYDLPILITLLKATRRITANTDDAAFIGELSLSGELRGVNGVLPMAIAAREQGLKKLYVPAVNANEGAVVDGLEVYPVRHVFELLDHLAGRARIAPAKFEEEAQAPSGTLDFSQVKGQAEAKRALEIAAAGGHNVLLIGSPGAGKSMLAKRMVTILPEMTFEETIETTKIHSIAGTLQKGAGLMTMRPFRSPHHTITRVGMTGGGTTPKPGEISLSHNGVLFLDELPEFPRTVLEVLRQPLEDGTVSIARAHGTYTYPSEFMLIAAMNPCPCGYYNHPKKSCSCSDTAVHKYLNRISGPLLDRIDIHIEVPPVEYDDLSSKSSEEKSEAIRRRVNAARQLQTERFARSKTKCNAHIEAALFEQVCVMDDKADRMLRAAFDKLGMTARAYDRIMKVARTIADLDQSEIIRAPHISEAIQYRSLDRKYWHE
ncbi:YifB family Mg chelatase-like AAA ATPase [Ruminococcus sp.]|uniref:YifB family Mg chelatase-like AAA ATPase n=1 Tax=Ruminococcus sp. TaxID=41978 RepID=UPI00388DC296